MKSSKIQTKLYTSIILFVLTLIISSVSVYAWIVASFKSFPIVIETGSLSVETTFYQANDANLDGSLDGGYTVINSGNLGFLDAMPGQVYTFRLEITNTGSLDGYLDVSVLDIVISDSSLLGLLQIDYIDPVTSNATTNVLNPSSYVMFTDYALNSGATLIVDFTITIEPVINNTSQLENVSIGYFLVRLDQ